MQKNWLKTIIALLICACMPLCGACGKGAASTEGMAIVLPTPTPEPEPEKGGELRLPMPTNAKITDPLSVNTEEMLGFYSLIFESLVTLDSTGQITPCLAENWSVDGSGRVWTFKLRNAQWHDGSGRLTAEDVKYSYDRIVAMGSDSYYAYNVSRIQSMYVVDESTLTIAMTSAGISPLYSLTFPIMKKDADTSSMPVGTGPYRVSYVAESEGAVTLTVNENWWKQTPYISTITFVERDNNETALASYAAGQLNMVPTSMVSVGRYREKGVTTVLDIMTQDAELLMVNMANSILKSLNIRKAIAYAIDRGTIITNIYMNRARASDVPVAPDSWLYDSKSKVYDYDPARASEILAAAGWADTDGDGVLEQNGRKLELTLLVCVGNDNLRKSAATLIASQLLKVGIKLNIVEAAYALNAEKNEFLELLQAGNYDLALMSISFGRDANLASLINAGGALNYGGYSDAAMDRLVQNVNTATDEAAYRSAASALQLRFVEEVPCIMLYFRLSSIVYASEIMGLDDVRKPMIFRNVEKWYIPQSRTD